MTSTLPTTSMSASERSPQQASRATINSLIKDRLQIAVTNTDREAVSLVERARPPALRKYDQIPMRADDLIRQVKLIAPYLEGQNVAFMGDADSTSALLGLLGCYGSPNPAHMLVVDFDERLLNALRKLADQNGFGARLELRLYNAFDPLPKDLIGKYDWFYTNPPYGCWNNGDSARLFITRGCEMTHDQGQGCIIIPDDPLRGWTRRSMALTQRFLGAYSWMVSEKLNQLHQYHLDDDQELASAMVLVQKVSYGLYPHKLMPYAQRGVPFEEIPRFYGRNVLPPYARYIRADGSEDMEWDRELKVYV